MPDEPDAQGLLALMLLTESRRTARTTEGGDLVLLADQDREPLGPRTHRRRPGHRAALPAAQPARAVSDPGRHQRRSQRRRPPRRQQTGRRSSSSTTSSLVTRPRARSWRSTAPSPGRGGRAADGARPRRRSRPRPRQLLPLPRHPRRPAAPPRPQQRGGLGIRGGDRTHRERSERAFLRHRRGNSRGTEGRTYADCEPNTSSIRVS